MEQYLVKKYQNCRKQVVGKLTKEFSNKAYEDVEDAYQEAFFVYESKLAKGEFVAANTCGYLYIVAKNKLRRIPAKNEVDILKVVNLVDRQTNNLLEISTQEIRLLCLNKALTQLDERCSTLVKLRYEEFKKLKDIWEDLGFPSYDAIKQKMRACKLKLKKLTDACIKLHPV